MTLWALGGTQEAGSTQFTADGNWTLVSAPVSVTNGGHTALRAELYLNTVNENLQVDGAQLVDTGLANSSWELGYFSGWDTYPFGAPAAAVSGTGGREGTGLGSVVVADAGRAVTQSLGAPGPGQSHVFSAWVRSPSNQPLAGALTLRALGGTEEAGTTSFVVGRRWTLISAPLNVAESGHTSMRAEVTVNTPGVELQVDGASLVAGNARDDTPLGYIADPAPPPPTRAARTGTVAVRPLGHLLQVEQQPGQSHADGAADRARRARGWTRRAAVQGQGQGLPDEEDRGAQADRDDELQDAVRQAPPEDGRDGRGAGAGAEHDRQGREVHRCAGRSCRR